MYTLRFPFKTPPDHAIAVDNVTFRFEDLETLLKQEHQYCVLEIIGFATEEAAKACIPRMRAGLMWLLLNSGLAVSAEF